MKRVLLDSNILIEAFNNKSGDAANKLKTLMNEENTTVFITPLISYEVLRGVDWNNEEEYQKIKNAIAQFSSINIDYKITQLASNLFRFEKYNRFQMKQQGKKIDKHNFDLVHFSTAKIHGLEFMSQDSDMGSWGNLYDQLLQQ
ncbi:type II toxin-antitoxin system VapC family toxin [Pelistega ratti]|uniref:type II toxin-antitoxin system VapC family toxin n=1 Tax=Pelistega ratti TaxID=2652177 RepID=UPI001358C27A|nr:PIN domain-containing protein [Pelistega ratti]